MIGRTISHYRILEPLGQGGMGEVYLAEDTKLDRKVALKFLPPALWNEAEAQQRLIREARAASQLDHPNIVTIYGIEEADGRPFIHMAHVQGVTLTAYCTAKPRTTGEILDLVTQIADGLQHAHEAGVVHRDLKPGNILVDERGRVRILDFGIASLRGAAKLTQTGFTVGTLAYAPPELIQGKQAEAPSDIYSLGVVLYQMLTGHLPFEADHEAALLYAVLQDAPKPMSAHRADVTPELQRIVSRCLEKQPEKRYTSCAELLDDLRRLRPRGAEAAPDGEAEKPSIAVLPFANMSADPENEYFSDGLSEELLNVLARNPDLKVTGRTSSFAFKGKHEDLREIGHKLGVGTILEGSVRKAGSRVRITTQLIKVSDGFHLWSETYDRVLDDIFAVQDDIAKAVSSALHVTLLGKPTATARVNPESYNLVLQANHLALRNTQVTLARAVELYRQALAIDPDDARAWAGLSHALGRQGGYGFEDVAESMARSRQAAEKALALDDGSAEAYEMMGWIHAIFEYRWDAAERAFRKAVSLSPGSSGPLTGLASFESIFGRHDEALRLGRKALDLDPLSPLAHMLVGRVQWTALRHGEARASYLKALELSPGLTPASAVIALTYLQQGRPAEGIEEARKESSAGYRNWALASIHHTLGDRQASDEALAALLREGEAWGFQIATVHAWRGENDRAFEWLERSYALRDSGIPITRMHPMLGNLHGDPRWPKFLEKIGMSG